MLFSVVFIILVQSEYPNDKFVLNPGFKYNGCKKGKFAGKDIHFEQVL